jgi:hypothetical protein
MRRTQLYLEDDMWNALHARAKTAGTSISELVRQAVRTCYAGQFQERKKAMQAFIGIGRDNDATRDPGKYVRALRRGTRLDRLNRK